MSLYGQDRSVAGSSSQGAEPQYRAVIDYSPHTLLHVCNKHRSTVCFFGSSETMYPASPCICSPEEGRETQQESAGYGEESHFLVHTFHVVPAVRNILPLPERPGVQMAWHIEWECNPRAE